MSTEIERKFLIDRPDEGELMRKPGCRRFRITQTYLQNIEPEIERRVRRIEHTDGVTFRYTEKKPLTGFRREEQESEITESDYRQALRDAVSSLEKTRYAIPFRDHVLEIDIYPDEIADGQLRGLAVLEIELGHETEDFDIPAFLHVRKELTGTKEFSNHSLAVPCEKPILGADADAPQHKGFMTEQ